MTAPLYGFIHIPKTGGSTLIEHLRRHLAFDEEFVHFGGAGERFRETEGRDPFEERSAERRQRATVMGGHYFTVDRTDLVPGRDVRLFVVVREPASRILSAYNFQCQRFGLDVSIDEWLASYPRNAAFKKIRQAFGIEGGDEVGAVRDAMRSMWFVGLTEHLDDDLPHLFRHLGAPETGWERQRETTGDVTAVEAALELDVEERWRVGNKVLRRLDMTDELRSRLYEMNPRDVKLYSLARRLRPHTLDALHGA